MMEAESVAGGRCRDDFSGVRSRYRCNGGEGACLTLLASHRVIKALSPHPEGDVPGLDRSGKPLYSRLRQGGVLLILFAAIYFGGTGADAGIGLIPTSITTTSLGGSNVGYDLIMEVPSDFNRYPGEKLSGRPGSPLMPRLNSPLASTPAALRTGEFTVTPTMNGVVIVTPSGIKFGGTCGSAEACCCQPALSNTNRISWASLIASMSGTDCIKNGVPLRSSSCLYSANPGGMVVGIVGPRAIGGGNLRGLHQFL
jgi:hypothetical protein